MDDALAALMIPAPETLMRSHTKNPYWDAIRALPGERFAWEYDHRWEPVTWHLGTGTIVMRQEYCHTYTWAIPDPLSLAVVAEHLAPCAVEIGSGTGYWAWQMEQLGVTMHCYDLLPPHLSRENIYHPPESEQAFRSVYTTVLQGNHTMAAQHPDCTLFLCWPPYESPMAADALRAYQGKKLVYIGEGQSGCCADDTFFALLDEAWELTDEHRPIQWSGIRDYIQVFERR